MSDRLYLYHYYEREKGPFLSLSDLPDEEAIAIPIEEVDLATVSFTYGDSFSTFDPTHGDTSEYRQNVYTLP